ncbi:fukutin [Caerostris extrusa]|uniref:Fukutin n=1 Tax=Caerostris extrusa TaxID=172846 RepID=A0AAV4P3U0_CAEEX|nr:fukutin [Caerostris extrusa]
MGTEDAFVSDLVYRPRTSLPLEGGASVFDRDISKCFTEPSKTFCLTTVNESLQAEEAVGKLEKEYYDGGNSDNNSLSTGTFHGHPIHHILSHFSKFMASLNIRPLLLEPSILYCASSPGNKITLLKKGFNPYDLQGSRLMITVGIFEEESKIFDLEEVYQKGFDFDFEVLKVRRFIPRTDVDNLEVYNVHIFFYHRNLVAHVVVFFKEKNFLWHYEYQGTEFDNMLFVKKESFENFTTVPLHLDKDKSLVYDLPSNPAQFLYQVESAEFLQCQYVRKDLLAVHHPTLTSEQMRLRATIAIQELKAIFLSRFINFWLWSESLDEWFYTCDIFHTTYELSIAVSGLSIKGVNLAEQWNGNRYLELVKTLNLENKAAKFILDCHGLRINIFVGYEEDDYIWFYNETAKENESNRYL